MDLIDRVAAASRELVSTDGQRRARVVLDQHGRPTGVTIDHRDGRQDASARPTTVRTAVSLSDRGITRGDAAEFIWRMSGEHGVRAWARQHGVFLPYRRIFTPTPNPTKKGNR